MARLTRAEVKVSAQLSSEQNVRRELGSIVAVGRMAPEMDRLRQMNPSNEKRVNGEKNVNDGTPRAAHCDAVCQTRVWQLVSAQS